MKRIIKTVLIVLFAFMGTAFVYGADKGESKIKICTYNIRGDLPQDGINLWKFRKDSLCKIVKHHDFDIVCMQEVLANQLEDIKERTTYDFVGVRGLYNPIFYKSDRFELLHNEIFWLSDSMELFSKGWDGKYDRYCIWAKFRDRRNGQIFFVFNTHLDHKGLVAQREGAKLICSEARKYAGNYPVFITGDMNSFDTTDAYKEYTKTYKDARKIASSITGPLGTAHNFGQVKPVRIDYIFVSDKINISKYGVDDEHYPNGFFPSDHYAVFVDAKISK
jgi:endonuclease/exonuclease/phosphatase family metal-dependent hydrolase